MTSNILSKIFAAAIAGCGLMIAPIAEAAPLIPDEEAEVDVSAAGCLEADKCITDLTEFGIASITSLVDDSTGTASRLFVDTQLTANIYSDPDAEFNNYVEFLESGDEGTRPLEFVYRPSTDEENGRLEVGTFRIDFLAPMTELIVDFFDVEWFRTTAVLGINGEEFETPDYIETGSDVVSRVYEGVTSILLQVGFDQDGENRTGDGVSFALRTPDGAAVPEPGSIVALSALAGGFLLKRRNGLSTEA